MMKPSACVTPNAKKLDNAIKSNTQGRDEWTSSENCDSDSLIICDSYGAVNWPKVRSKEW